MTITMAAPTPPLRFTQQRDAFGDREWVTSVPGPDGAPVTFTNREVVSALHLSAAQLRHDMPADELAQLVTCAVATAGPDAIRAHAQRDHALCLLIATETTAETDWRAADQERRGLWRSDARYSRCLLGMLALLDASAGRDAR